MVFEKVATRIAKQLDIDASKINMESRLIEDLKADSLDLVELVPPLLDCPVHGALEPRLQMVQSFPQVSLIWNRQFCAVGGGRGPQVCHKVRAHQGVTGQPLHDLCGQLRNIKFLFSI